MKKSPYFPRTVLHIRSAGVSWMWCRLDVWYERYKKYSCYRQTCLALFLFFIIRRFYFDLSHGNENKLYVFYTCGKYATHICNHDVMTVLISTLHSRNTTILFKYRNHQFVFQCFLYVFVKFDHLVHSVFLWLKSPMIDDTSTATFNDTTSYEVPIANIGQ